MVGVNNGTHCFIISKMISTNDRKVCQNNLSKYKWSQQKGNVLTWPYDSLEVLRIQSMWLLKQHLVSHN